MMNICGTFSLDRSSDWIPCHRTNHFTCCCVCRLIFSKEVVASKASGNHSQSTAIQPYTGAALDPKRGNGPKPPSFSSVLGSECTNTIMSRARITHPEPENAEAALEKLNCISANEPNDSSIALAKCRSCMRTSKSIAHGETQTSRAHHHGMKLSVPN